MGDSTTRRIRSSAPDGFRICLALLALAISSQGNVPAPGPQAPQSVRELTQRSQAIIAEIARATGGERERAITRLVANCDQLEARLADATSSDEATLLLGLFRTYTALGEFQPQLAVDRRIEFLEHAREYAQILQNADAVARTHLIAADVWNYQGDNGRARAELLQVIEGLPDARSNQPFALAQLAEAERQLGSMASALGRIADARAALPRDDPRFAALALTLEGTEAQILVELGLADQAAPHVARESEAAAGLAPGEPSSIDRRIAASIHAANLGLLREDFEGALAIASRALGEPTTTTRGRDWRGTLLGIRGAAEVALVRAGSLSFGEAATTLESALAIPGLARRDRLFCLLRLAELEVLDARFESARGHLEATRQLLPMETSISSEAMQLAALTTRIALQTGASRPVLEACASEMSVATAGFLKSWKQAPIRSGGIGFLRPRNRRALLSEGLRLTLALQGEADGTAAALMELMRMQALGSTERRAGLSPGDLRAVRAKLLAPNRGMLVFLPGPDQSHVFALDQDSLTVTELAGTDHIGPLRRRWLQALASAADPAVEVQLAAEVTAALLPPAVRRKLMAWDGFTVIGEDLWGRLPFGELVLQDNERLALRAVDYLPSLPLGLWLKERDTSANMRSMRRIRLVASSPSDSAKERWSAVGQFKWEGPTLTELTAGERGEHTHATSGSSATPEALFQATSNQAEVLEVVAHGVQDYEREQPSLLVLAPIGGDDGLVSAERIEAGYADRSPPALVILAACRTASGPERPGDGATAHLGSAFLRAGARAVLQSDGDLPFAATAKLLAVLHRELCVPGTSPAAALSAALRRTRGSPDAALLRRLHIVGLGHVPMLAPQ